jgi:hypothetical protein
MSSSAATPVGAPEPQLSPERLDCYRVALEFNVLAAHLVPRGHRDLRDQLTRAALSISANLAEGCGRRAVAVCKDARWLLVRIVQMLTKLEAATAR